MARSYLSIWQRWEIYQRIPTDRRDILDVWLVLTGWC